MGFLVNTKHTHKHKVTSNKTVPKLCTILTKCFFHMWILQATLNQINLIMHTAKFDVFLFDQIFQK